MRLRRELDALASTALAARPRLTVCTRVPSSSEKACWASFSRCWRSCCSCCCSSWMCLCAAASSPRSLGTTASIKFRSCRSFLASSSLLMCSARSSHSARVLASWAPFRELWTPSSRLTSRRTSAPWLLRSSFHCSSLSWSRAFACSRPEATAISSPATRCCSSFRCSPSDLSRFFTSEYLPRSRSSSWLKALACSSSSASLSRSSCSSCSVTERRRSPAF
mmetsp:Transcript_19632/g.47524  ORF Transcript_19632/g.47524 Transcript_19632/m.47524 type:complete len:221 (+) Transcript_19632:306-968(+)